MTTTSQQRTVALTGATGFIGAHALRALLAHGAHVRALARDPARLQRTLASLPTEWRQRLTIIPGALAAGAHERDHTDALKRLLADADAVLHVAGVVRALDEPAFMRVNAEAAAHLARLADAAGVPRFVQVSSLAARAPHLSAYARSKREGERAVLDILGPRTVAVRPPAVYGPGDEATFGLVDQLSRPRALVPGHADMRVSLIHVRDLAEALARLALDEAAGGGEVLEIDDGRENGYSWADIAREAARALGRPVKLHLLPRPLVGTAALAADITARLLRRPFMLSREKVNELYHHDWVVRAPKVSDRLHWTASLQFAEGFLDTLAWWCRQGRLPESRLPVCSRPEMNTFHRSERSD